MTMPYFVCSCLTLSSKHAAQVSTRCWTALPLSAIHHRFKTSSACVGYWSRYLAIVAAVLLWFQGRSCVCRLFADGFSCTLCPDCCILDLSRVLCLYSCPPPRCSAAALAPKMVYSAYSAASYNLSISNIMVPRTSGKAYGILNDFDLARIQGFSKMSSQRTGTQPFMAIDLLSPSEREDEMQTHLPRFDLESLFYVLL